MIAALLLALCAAPAVQAQDPTAALSAAEADRASALLAEGKAAEAVALLRAGLERQKEAAGEDSLEFGRALNNLAYALSQAGDIDAALASGEHALTVMQGHGDPSPGTAMVRRNLGEIAARGGRLALGRTFLEAAAADFEATYGKTPMAAETRAAAAAACLALGDLAAAQAHLEWAVAIQEGVVGPLNPSTARAIHQLAGVLALRGQFDAALLLEEHVLRLAEGMEGAGVLWAEVRQQRAAWLAALGDFEAARAEIDALAAAAAPASDAERALLALDLAREYLDLGAPVEALDQLAAMPAELEPLQRGAQADFRARAQAMLGRHAEAEASAGDALAVLQPLLGEQPNDLIAGLLLSRGSDADIAAALQMRRAGLGEDHPLFGDVLHAFLESELRKAKLTREMIDLVDMSEAPRARTSPSRLSRWGQIQQSTAGALVHAAWLVASQRQGRLAEAFIQVERERQRSQSTATAWWIETGAAAAEPALRAYLNDLHRGEEQLLPPAKSAASWSEKRAALRASGSRWATLAAPEGASLEQARAWLNADDQALLCFSWTAVEVWGLVLRRDPARDLLLSLGPADRLEPMLQAAQAALRDLDQACDLDSLSAAVLHPLWPALADCTAVTVVADGPLAFLPLEALPVPDGERWVRSCRLSYAPSVSDLLRLQASPAAASGALHVGPGLEHPNAVAVHLIQRIRDRFAVAPAAGAAGARAELLPEGETAWVGADALESRLKALDAAGGLAELRLLHLRAPAYVDAEVPSATAVVLGPEAGEDGLSVWQRENGLLDLAELSGLHLNAALVLLPLAETGPQPDAAGLRADGLHALVRGLWASGARGVLLSGWTLGGVAAANFDALLIQQARAADPSRALWNAQQEWLRRASADDAQNLAHPGYWARLRHFGR